MFKNLIIIILTSLFLYGCDKNLNKSAIYNSLEYCKDKNGIQFLFIDGIYSASESYVKCNDNSIKYLKDMIK